MGSVSAQRDEKLMGAGGTRRDRDGSTQRDGESDGSRKHSEGQRWEQGAPRGM